MAESEQPQPALPKCGQDGYRNPPLSGPSTIHPAQREVGAPENYPHSVPHVMERISNVYMGHAVDGDHTRFHGVLYSVLGRPFPGGLGDAIAWCIQNPKPIMAVAPALELAGEPEPVVEPAVAPALVLAEPPDPADPLIFADPNLRSVGPAQPATQPPAETTKASLGLGQETMTSVPGIISATTD